MFDMSLAHALLKSQKKTAIYSCYLFYSFLLLIHERMAKQVATSSTHNICTRLIIDRFSKNWFKMQLIVTYK